MTDLRVLPSAGFRPQPWKNGHGTTAEIAQGPGGDAWAWRLSIADSEVSARFSHFEGIDRHLVLLDGAGLDLEFDDGELISLRAPLATARFAGERAVTGAPFDGPTSQLNVMWSRDRISTELSVRSLTGTTTLDLRPGASTFLVVADGSLAAGPDGAELLAGDVAMAHADRPGDSLTLVGDAHVVIGTFHEGSAGDPTRLRPR